MPVYCTCACTINRVTVAAAAAVGHQLNDIAAGVSSIHTYEVLYCYRTSCLNLTVHTYAYLDTPLNLNKLAQHPTHALAFTHTLMFNQSLQPLPKA